MIRLLLAAIITLVVVCPVTAQDRFAGEVPAELEGADIVDRSGEMVPEDIELVNEHGEPVRVGDFLNGSRPLVVQFVYYNCPMLCTLVLNGYLDAAKELDWVPGQDYEVLSVSFDPADTPALALAKKKNYVEALGKEGAGEGWHFLTGDSAQVYAFTQALGFGFRWVEEKKEFAHAAGMFVLTPEGKVSRTLYGIEFPVKDLRLSLVEAGEGRLGSPFDRLLLYCFQYDSETHKYSLVARNVMKLGGLLTVIAIGAFLTIQWGRERRQHPVTPAA